jgi:hypothetical protein
MEQQAKHTPGPWMFYAQEGGCDIYVRKSMGKGPLLAHVVGLGQEREKLDEFAANARLIAAAPDLLAALTEVLEWIRNWSPEFAQDDEWPATATKASAAIAKATAA